jgi:hypothetical protein
VYTEEHRARHRPRVVQAKDDERARDEHVALTDCDDLRPDPVITKSDENSTVGHAIEETSIDVLLHGAPGRQAVVVSSPSRRTVAKACRARWRRTRLWWHATVAAWTRGEQTLLG